MRTWSRCAVETTCGHCGNRMRVGTPMQTIRPDAVHAPNGRFVRCPICAEGEPPDDLPPLADHVGPRPTGQDALPLGDRR